MKEFIGKTDNKRERILLAAVEVFTKNGFNNARMEQIAETAGIGKGTIYEYFDSKLQLFNEMIIRSWEEYANNVAADKMQEMSFEEAVRTILAGHFRFCQEKKKLTRILFWDTEIMNDELKEWMYSRNKKRETALVEIVDLAIKRGEIKPVEHRLVYLILTGLIGSTWALTAIEDWDIDTEILADQLTDAVMNGIKR